MKKIIICLTVLLLCSSCKDNTSINQNDKVMTCHIGRDGVVRANFAEYSSDYIAIQVCDCRKGITYQELMQINSNMDCWKFNIRQYHKPGEQSQNQSQQNSNSNQVNINIER